MADAGLRTDRLTTAQVAAELDLLERTVLRYVADGKPVGRGANRRVVKLVRKRDAFAGFYFLAADVAAFRAKVEAATRADAG